MNSKMLEMPNKLIPQQHNIMHNIIQNLNPHPYI